MTLRGRRMLPARFLPAAELLAIKHEIRTDSIVAGAFTEDALRVVEIVMHELAHLLSAGVPERGLYESGDIHTRIDNALDGKSPTVQDALEVDTAIIVFCAGYELGLWSTDKIPAELVEATGRNMVGSVSRLSLAKEMHSRLRKAVLDEPRGVNYYRQRGEWLHTKMRAAMRVADSIERQKQNGVRSEDLEGFDRAEQAAARL